MLHHNQWDFWRPIRSAKSGGKSVLWWKIFCLCYKDWIRVDGSGRITCGIRQFLKKFSPVISKHPGDCTQAHGVWKTEEAENYFSSTLQGEWNIVMTSAVTSQQIACTKCHPDPDPSSVFLTIDSHPRDVPQSLSIIIFEIRISALLAQLWRTSPHHLDILKMFFFYKFTFFKCANLNSFTRTEKCTFLDPVGSLVSTLLVAG